MLYKKAVTTDAFVCIILERNEEHLPNIGDTKSWKIRITIRHCLIKKF